MTLHRRTLLQAFTAGTLIGATNRFAHAALKPTRRDAEGPYYPVEPIPLDTNLLLATTHVGDLLRFSGRVVDTDGVVIAGCRVEIWQCDGNSVYRHPSAPDRAQADPAFRGFGAALTDDNGEFAFDTIVPVAYPGRPPHIHARLWVENESRLTTQVYLAGNRGSDARKIDPVEQGDGYAARFEFVLG